MIRQLAATLLFTGCGAFASLSLRAADSPKKPNVVVILADDLGFSDLGCYGGEIQTPNLDRLARGGLRFTQFYNTARCWPTRAALLTGYYAQQVRRDTLPGIPTGTRGKRPPWARLLPDVLRPLGYRSYHSGKWHIDGMPVASGFDRSFRLADHGRYFHPQRIFEDDRPLAPIKPGTKYYTTVAVADHAIKCLKDHQTQHADKPFFHFVAFTAPHFPLHALPEDIERYRGRYDRGWKVVRAERWKRLQKLGIVDGKLSDVERQIGPEAEKALEILGPGEVNRRLAWERLTDEQRRFQAAKMEIHAAMVDRMDREIGRIVDQLRAMDALDDTLLFFLSDNGASAEILVRDDGHDRSASPGSAASHLCLGPGWSATSNTPFRRHKMWVHQGGISTPLVVHWPRGIQATGELRRNVGHVVDLVPTIVDAAGGKRLTTYNDKPVPAPPGKSILPVFAKDGTVARDDLWWFHNGNRAIRIGDWKLVAAGARGPWELYNVVDDPTETTNLAAKHPEKVRQLRDAWQQHLEEFRATATADLPAK